MSTPRFIPALQPSQIDHGPERHVAVSLQNTLDDEWTVFHSYSWLREQGQRGRSSLQEGEIDFVLLHPTFGLLVLEVKGGRIGYDPGKGLWYQNNHTLKDPFKQAQKNMHALIDQVQERAKFSSRGRMPCPFGYAVIFPDCQFSGVLPQGAHPTITLSAQHCPDLGSHIQKALKHWARGSVSPMHKSDFKELESALLPQFRIVRSLARDVERDEELLIQLTEQQTEALESIYMNQRVLIEGTAGSGKTLLALQRAQAFAQEGKSVLFLCYNKKLAAWLQRRTASVPEIRVIHFHALCHESCKKVDISWNPPPPSDPDGSKKFWEEDAPELLLDAIDDLEERYDAIIVDEGQDFRDHWWTAIEAFHKTPHGPLYIFFDRAQNLYATDLTFPKCETRYNLRINCRNTRKIADACEGVLGAEIRVSRFSPEGQPPLVIPYQVKSDVQKACTNILKKVVGEEGIPSSRVAILGPYTLKKSSLGNASLGKYNLVNDVKEWQQGKGVWYSTIRSFKGLEADVLVLIDLEDFQEGFFERYDLFVACSRARHRLIAYTKSQQVLELMKDRSAVPGAR